MNIINQFRRKVRIVEEVCDTRYLQAAQEAEYHVPQTDTDYPVYLTVKVQVKVAFVWVTVWAESCDITDGDTPMDNELCGTCLSYDPDKETQGFGELHSIRLSGERVPTKLHRLA